MQLIDKAFQNKNQLSEAIPIPVPIIENKV